MLNARVAKDDDFNYERSVRSVQRAVGFKSAFGAIPKKKALQRNAIRNFSLFTLHFSLSGSLAGTAFHSSLATRRSPCSSS
jgi:hypothetical protein